MGRFKWERRGRDSVRPPDDPNHPRTRCGTRAFALLALVSALAGCTVVGPLFVKPADPVNPDWTAKTEPQVNTAQAADAAWWRAFNDPILDKLVELAWQQNLTVRAAGLRIAEARAQLALAVGQKWPQVQAAFGQASITGLSNNAANVSNFDRNFSEFQAGFDVAWEIDFWGRYQNMQRAEASRYFGSIADYDSALVTLSAEVARTYAVIRMYETLVALAQ